MKLLKNIAIFPLFTLCLLSSVSASADHNGRFDPTPVWPLCGRIPLSSPPDCPMVRWGNPDFTDAPMSSTFGPRQKASQAFRYDFHRGIDIPTTMGTPVFAVADGVVLRVGNDPFYADTLVQIQHYRPGHSDCNSGCYYSNYLHLEVDSWVVNINDTVSKGQYIANAGSSLSGFEHLHFEIREAPGDHDPESAWQRDAVHPLLMLPYADTGAANMTVGLDVDDINPLNPLATVTVMMANGVELDLNRIEVEVYEKIANALPQLIPQPGNTGTGNTPENMGHGYNVNPPWFDMMQFNRQYSYKDSIIYPWAEFKTGGPYESPYAVLLPAFYDPNIHLDQNGGVGDESRGFFNGLIIAPTAFNIAADNYGLTVTFNELVGVADANNLCLRARAEDAAGNVTGWVQDNCAVTLLNDNFEN